MQFSHVRTNWWKKDAVHGNGNGGGGFRSKLCAQQAHGDAQIEAQIDAQIEAMHMMVATVVGDAVLMIPDRSGS